MRIAELVGRGDDDVQRIALHLQAAADVAHGLQPTMQAVQGTEQHLRIAKSNVRLDAILDKCQILVHILVEKDVQLVECILLKVIAARKI